MSLFFFCLFLLHCFTHQVLLQVQYGVAVFQQDGLITSKGLQSQALVGQTMKMQCERYIQILMN